MNKAQSKRQRSIKSKLMAAICMLLVSSIMMVSTTYAWFTLSTAPEVTGINTAVGANGNLEMALMPYDGQTNSITSGTEDSMATKATNLANVTWGNLVDLSDNTFYGLDKITLYPSKLNLDAQTGLIKTNPLAIPTYGSDGRMSGLNENSTMTGVYTGGAFMENIAVGGTTIDKPMGVRAIGTVSGMTDRQLAFRAALAEASTAASRAQKVASDVLKTEGPKLAGIAITHATAGENESYTKDDVQSLKNMVDALIGTATEKGSLSMIEDAIKYYLVAAAASQNLGSEANYKADGDHILATNLENLEDKYIPGVKDDPNTDVDESTGMTKMVSKLAESLRNAKGSQTALASLLDSGATSFTWAQIEPALTDLADPTKMEINDIPVGDLNKTVTDSEGKPVTNSKGETQTYMSQLIGSALTKGLNLSMGTGAGVYADIADFTGDYSATIVIPNVSYGGLNVDNVPATMSTKTSINPNYLDQAQTYVRTDGGTPAGSTGNGNMPISDYYGYIIDLAFRTNAADSYLLLQSDAVDRVYQGNTANDQTMGAGATMEFSSSDLNFNTNNVLNLMGCIKIVFFNPVDNSIVSYAKLDTENATTDANGKVTAKIVLCEANGTAKTENATRLMALEQNKAHQLSVMVYLDGEKVTNATVANAAQSMVGKLNLQFASSANLKPMEYTDLRQGSADAASSFNLKNVTVTGATKGQAKYASGTIGIQLAEVPANSTITIKVGDAQPVEVQATTVDFNGTPVTGISYAATGVDANTPIVVTVTAPASGT